MLGWLKGRCTLKLLYSGDEREDYGARWMDGPDRLVAFWNVCVCDGREKKETERNFPGRGLRNTCEPRKFAVHTQIILLMT